jgi:hypothetical protein
VSVETITSRIDAAPDDVARLLADELGRGRVRRTDGGGWSLVADAFAPEVFEALSTSSGLGDSAVSSGRASP